MRKIISSIALIVVLAGGVFAGSTLANNPSPKPGEQSGQHGQNNDHGKKGDEGKKKDEGNKGEGDKGKGSDNAHNKVTLCHATGSSSNPYVVITVDANGAINGHAKHSGDIIPPFDYNDHGKTVHFVGLNFNSQGQAALANGCKVAAVTTTTSPATTTTVPGSTTTVPGPGATTTVAAPTKTVTTTPVVTVKKPPVKVTPKPQLPKPTTKTKVKPSVFPYTP